MRLKDFFQRWWQGVLALPAEEQIKIRIILQVGISLSYLSGVVAFFVVKTYWYVGILFLFFFGQAIVEFISLRQQLSNLKKLKEMV